MIISDDVVLQGSKQVEITNSICLISGIFMEVFGKNLDSTGFYSTENYCFNVNDIVLTECSRYIMV